MDYQIFDKFLPDDTFYFIKNSMTVDGNFPWYFNNFVVDSNEDNGSFQFTHLFYFFDERKSELSFIIEPLIRKINPKKLLRVKANLTTKTPNIIETGYHLDFEDDCYTSVFYVNTNNGYTKIKGGELINSVENRLVVFKSNLLHTGSTCTDENIRVVINLNFTK